MGWTGHHPMNDRDRAAIARMAACEDNGDTVSLTQALATHDPLGYQRLLRAVRKSDEWYDAGCPAQLREAP